eukprot:CAMPEP_0118828170 /NCGR_PEP_ID=MMETSP1162-20130426/17041_1 /TAXON_ID=33656 /ORGANISM="Phaeocystis Sp, Strain CCMP2710" /LENGTH=102 /DNA_ID=CAMNT_0006759111 /DNA_START=325 /DNA_END=630 /DNA_ORIENTATION=-
MTLSKSQSGRTTTMPAAREVARPRGRAHAHGGTATRGREARARRPQQPGVHLALPRVVLVDEGRDASQRRRPCSTTTRPVKSDVLSTRSSSAPASLSTSTST